MTTINEDGSVVVYEVFGWQYGQETIWSGFDTVQDAETYMDRMIDDNSGSPEALFADGTCVRIYDRSRVNMDEAAGFERALARVKALREVVDVG
jgi:hypothetical protein